MMQVRSREKRATIVQIKRPPFPAMPPFRHLLTAAMLIAAGAPLALAGETPKPMSRAEAYRQATELEALGHQLFFDPILSGSGRESCSTCHAPDRGFAPANALPVQFGGLDMKAPGTRAAPSLTYLQATPQFTEHYFDNEDEGDESVDNGPTGGLTWDGRADRPRDQAKIPLLAANEMANPSEQALVARIAESRYAPALRAIYGADVFADPDLAFTGILTAIETFQEDSKTFYPYTSKYDAYLQGRAKLTDQEVRGLALFTDETKGNCSSCHISDVASDGTPPQFSDFGMIALGVPRNPDIPANEDPSYFDLGLCGPLRTDFKGEADYCGLFKTPSLRNVALRQTFMHNGFFHSLRKVVEFYATRDTNPEKWYPRKADGTIDAYNDLPAAYRANLNTDPPFGGKPGDKPALDDKEIDDIVAFLGTLTDGWKP